MNDTKHTPGPWHQEDGQIFGPNPDFDATDLQSNAEILIADTAPEGAALTEYDEANARLIAAAPDLLAALETAHAALCRLRDEDIRQIEAMPAIELAAAILKKTGEGR